MLTARAGEPRINPHKDIVNVLGKKILLTVEEDTTTD
jgi:hypothetical protein